MKRIITLTAALFISAAVFAQAGDNAPKEVKAWSGKAYAVHQESYTPSFDIDGKNTKVRNVILMIGDVWEWELSMLRCTPMVVLSP